MKLKQTIKQLAALWSDNQEFIDTEEKILSRSRPENKANRTRYLRKMRRENAAIDDALQILEAIDTAMSA